MSTPNICIGELSEIWSTGFSLPIRDKAILLALGDGVVVGSGENLVYTNKSGIVVWTQTKAYNSVFFVQDNLVYYATRSARLNAINTEGIFELTDAPLPGFFSPSEYQLELLVPFDGGFISASYGISRSVVDHPDGASEDIDDPLITWRISEFGRRIGKYGSKLRMNQVSKPIYLPKERQLCFLSSDCYVCISLDNIPEDDSDDILYTQTYQLTSWFSHVNDWSADNNGHIGVLGVYENKTTLVVFTYDGTADSIWRSDTEEGVCAPYQPPIFSTVFKRVYVLETRRVIAIENGNLTWEYKINEENFSSMVEMGDGSLIVTAGNRLVHLSAIGTLICDRELRDTIIGTPLITSGGEIYLSTCDQLTRLL